ncbi:hypothetical protein E6H14_07505 [Candidatus Bathyarchaeota archaeon]|nr:MAG: hypothetical protein E6H14_07505 [Candidatus Bathyarchaeota archaeon]
MSLNLRKLGVAPLPVAAILTLAFAVFGIGEELIYQSVLLEILLNVFLVLAVSIIVARVSVKSFLSTGSLNVLLLGTAVLAFGTMATLGGAVSSIDVSKGIAVYSFGALTAGSLHLASAILTYRGSPRRNARLKLRAGACYLGTVTFLTTLSILAIESLLPASFGQTGSIAQRAAAATTVSLFTISAILFSRVYLRSHNPILYWYSLALWATAVGFLSFFATKGNGDPLLWTGIASVCVGSVYFLFSILAVPNSRSDRKPPEQVS